jgi:hypothetical protein
MKSSAKGNRRPANSRARYLAAKASLKADRFLEVVAGHKNPSQRLSEFFKISAEKQDVVSTSFRETLFSFAKQLDKDKEWHLSNFNLEDPEVRAVYALESTRLGSDITDWPLVEAFRKAGLDDKNPLHWRMLLMFFCWSHFPPKRTVGISTLWTTEKYCQLLQEFHKLKPRRQMKRWENAASIKLSKKAIFKKKNKPLSAGALRRALLDARDPKHNYALNRLIHEAKRALKEDYEQRGHVWPSVHFENILERAHNVECTLNGNIQRTESSGVRSDASEFDVKDKIASLKLLDELRARVHEGLLAELSAAGAESYHCLLKFLENRRVSSRDELLKALVEVSDYDCFPWRPGSGWNSAGRDLR